MHVTICKHFWHHLSEHYTQYSIAPAAWSVTAGKPIHQMSVSRQDDSRAARWHFSDTLCCRARVIEFQKRDVVVTHSSRGCLQHEEYPYSPLRLGVPIRGNHNVDRPITQTFTTMMTDYIPSLRSMECQVTWNHHFGPTLDSPSRRCKR